MTIAICIVCGAQKFGVFVRCKECGFEPTDLTDKAKSLALSDHNFPQKELEKFSKALKFQDTVPFDPTTLFDPITLAVVARPIAEDDYYSNNLDNCGTLACMRCGVEFRPDVDQVFCASCRAEMEEQLSVCTKCSLIFDTEAKHCQQCGARLHASVHITVKGLAERMGIGIGRTLEKGDILPDSSFLADVRKRIPKEQRYKTNRELMIAGLFCALLTLSKAVPSVGLRFRIRQELAALYVESHMLRGADINAACSMRDHCQRRWDEYTAAMAHNPERGFLLLGDEAAKNCFGIEHHLGAASEMMVFIGYMSKVLQSGVIDSIIRREVNAP